MTDEHKPEVSSEPPHRLPPGTAARLSCYLHILMQSAKAGRTFISSQALSEHARVNPTQIRRDLTASGAFGRRGVGYEIDSLIGSIRRIIGAAEVRELALIGAGNLGISIAGCDIYREHGFRITAIFDTDPAKTGVSVAGVPVQPVSEVGDTVGERGIAAAVIAVPAAYAQEAADRLFGNGVRVVLNYSGGLVKAPPGAAVHDINPAEGLLKAMHLCGA